MTDDLDEFELEATRNNHAGTVEVVPTFASEAGPPLTSETVPTFASEAGPPLASETVPTFASEVGPPLASETVPTFASEAAPTFAPEAVPNLTCEPGPARLRGRAGRRAGDALDNYAIAPAAPSARLLMGSMTTTMARQPGPGAPREIDLGGGGCTAHRTCLRFRRGYLAGRPFATARPRSARAGARAPLTFSAGPGRARVTEGAISDAAGDAAGDRRDTGGDAPVSIQPDQSTSNGRLLVRSTPADAQVFVDGREVGRTPATIRGLARGAHRLRVVRDGYLSEERPIVITAERPAQSVSVTWNVPRRGGIRGAEPGPETVAVDGTLVGA